MDMLSFSKDREPALEPCDLNETVADVVELMQSRASELGVTLHWEPAADLPQVQIDSDGIHRAVLNIATNAIDAAEGVAEGRVDVSTEWDEETSTARVRVADNGVGIEEKEIASIFQVFASTKGSRGTGLGLPVSQKIVREHGGKIVVTSQVGQGSQFVIELPAKRGEPRFETAERPVMPE
jgi:signal transduction histidine kinase